MGDCPCSNESVNPFYIGPYADKACSTCPYGIYSGFLSCGWPDRCRGMAERNACLNCCSKQQSQDQSDNGEGNQKTIEN